MTYIIFSILILINTIHICFLYLLIKELKKDDIIVEGMPSRKIFHRKEEGAIIEDDEGDLAEQINNLLNS